MPLFEHHTDPETGRTWMKEIHETVISKQVEAVRPASADVAGPSRKKVYQCTHCEDIRFRSAGLASRHFNKEHDDLKADGQVYTDHFEVFEE